MLKNKFFLPLSDLEIGRGKKENKIMDELKINCHKEDNELIFGRS